MLFRHRPSPVFATAGEGTQPPAPPAPPAAPWAAAPADKPWSIGEAGKEQPWWNTIGEEPIRKHVEAKGYRTPAELAVANYNLTRLQANDPKVAAIPGEGATDAEWGQFYDKLGRPKDKAAYDFKMPDGVKMDTATVEFGKELFFEMGLDGKRAQKAVDKWNQFVASQTTAAQTAAATENANAIAALEKKWGGELDKHKATALRVVNALGPDAKPLIDKVGEQIGHAAVVELLALIGSKSGEGNFVSGGNTTDPNDTSTMTKEQAKARISQLEGDAEFQKKYTTKTHPEHAAALAMMEKLFIKAA